MKLEMSEFRDWLQSLGRGNCGRTKMTTDCAIARWLKSKGHRFVAVTGKEFCVDFYWTYETPEWARDFIRKFDQVGISKMRPVPATLALKFLPPVGEAIKVDAKLPEPKGLTFIKEEFKVGDPWSWLSWAKEKEIEHAGG